VAAVAKILERAIGDKDIAIEAWAVANGRRAGP
jgi:hypothetical protein